MFKNLEQSAWSMNALAFVIGVIIFALFGWNIAEPWAWISTTAVFLLFNGIKVFSKKEGDIDTSTQNSTTMTLDQLVDKIDEGNLADVFSSTLAFSQLRFRSDGALFNL